MRPNKKEQILRTAVQMIGAHGLEALTFESLAEASGFSKSGLIYHFPSRHELLLSIHRHLAQEWEEDLISFAGGPAAEMNQATRLRASVLSMSQTATRADLLVALDAPSHPDFRAVWATVNQRWMPSPMQINDDPTRRAAYLVQLMADGLWVHDHIHEDPLTPEQRGALAEAILAMIPEG
ncbi:HTH-type transcriptional regulator RutR [Corynebacterium occultum]|uniref:HTH-type transcriptional regulator RutR n=1 Tax=Corynebacterium occultum TaxID=2675219 RepID=A0A6B8W6M3_9CORY|nr:TetR/AcrR family transcriptional regulator [Corynebacterium occultum]QGU08261.1 HTH-type transcriptional regulator RutR [Corynebacterium occultum]